MLIVTLTKILYVHSCNNDALISFSLEILKFKAYSFNIEYRILGCLNIQIKSTIKKNQRKLSQMHCIITLLAVRSHRYRIRMEVSI